MIGITIHMNNIDEYGNLLESQQQFDIEDPDEVY